MGQLKPEQYAAARRMIDEEIIGEIGQHRGRILDSWYERLAQVLQIPIDDPTIEEIEDIAKKIGVPKLETVYLDVVEEFVKNRNRLPHKKDPRIKKIAEIIEGYCSGFTRHYGPCMSVTPNFSKLSEEIVKALENKDAIDDDSKELL